MFEYKKYVKDKAKYGDLQNTSKNSREMETVRNPQGQWGYYLLLTKEEYEKVKLKGLDIYIFTYLGKRLGGKPNKKRKYQYSIGGDFGDPPINFSPGMYKYCGESGESNNIFKRGKYMAFGSKEMEETLDSFSIECLKLIKD